MTRKFLECVHIFVLSWKGELTKRGCNLKTQNICYSIRYRSVDSGCGLVGPWAMMTRLVGHPYIFCISFY